MFAVDEGERVVNNQLGSRFRRYLFDPDIQTVRQNCENEVNRIFSTFFPQLNLTRLSVQVAEDDQNKVMINITYNFKNLEALQDSLKVIIG
jgi:phage baseplate assembly protein W